MIQYLPADWLALLFQIGEVALLAAALLTVYANVLTRLFRAEGIAQAAVVAEALRVEAAASAELVAARLQAEAVLAADRVLAAARLAEGKHE